MKTKEAVDAAFAYTKKVGVPMMVGVPNYELIDDTKADLGTAYSSAKIGGFSGLKTIDEVIDFINSRILIYNQAKWTIFKRASKYYLNVQGFRKSAWEQVIPILSNGGGILSQAIREHNFASLERWGIAFGPTQISYGLDFASSVAPTHEMPDDRQYQIPTPELTYKVNRFPSLEVSQAHYDDGDIPSILYEIKGFALGWRDRDEPFILVQDSLDLPTSDNGQRFAIQIKKEDQILTAIASHEEAVGDYFLIHLDMRKEENKKLPPFGDWIGAGPAYEISKGVLITRRPAGEVILQLLESGGGGSVNGAYDLQLVGCNLDSSFINETSFLRYNSSSAISEWQFSLPADEVTLRDVLDPMLKTMGAALVMDRSSYSPKISIVLLGHEADEDQQSFSDLDFLASKPPYWTNFEDIVTQFKFIYDMQNEEPTTRIINNYDAINRLAGETKSMELSLYGITSDLLGGTTASDFLESFLPTYARLFRLYGQAMRMWFISIGTGKALTLDLGSYLKISSDFLKAYTDDYGISQKVGMIKKININLMGEGAEIELIHLGDSSPTWNASAYVSSVIDSDTIAIDTDYFSSADANYFQVGNVVKRSTPGSDDTTTTLTISQINGNQISFTSSHSASAGDVIQPTDYTTASSNHTKRAYIDRGFKYE